MAIVEAGKTINSWTVESRYGDKRLDKWNCVCVCGNKSIVGGCNLRANRSKKCKNCRASERGTRLATKLEKGTTFGSWVIVEFDYSKKGKGGMHICDCACGRTRTSVRTQNLIKGTSTKCERCRNDDNLGEKNGVWSGYGELNGKHFTQICKNAERAGRKFELSKEWLWQLFLKQERRCAISGMELQFGKGLQECTASLDRKDSSTDYIKNNVQWVHKDVNSLKSDWPQNKLIWWCNKIAEFQNGKKQK